MLLHDRAVGASRGCQPLASTVGETRVGTAGIVFAATASDQLLALQTIHQASETAAGQLGLLCQIAHAHTPAGCVGEMLKHLI